MKNKPILFIDFNGVLSYNKFWHSIHALDHPLYKYSELIEEYLFSKNRHLVADWMIGKYTSEQIHQILSKEINIPYELLLETFINDCINIDISERILKYIKKLKKYYFCILITDNMDSFTRFTLPNSNLAQVFDKIFNSYELKASKRHNQGGFFLKQVKEFQSDIKSSIFIDDSLKNCELFATLGGIGIQVTEEKNVLIELKKILNAQQSK